MNEDFKDENQLIFDEIGISMNISRSVKEKMANYNQSTTKIRDLPFEWKDYLDYKNIDEYYNHWDIQWFHLTAGLRSWNILLRCTRTLSKIFIRILSNYSRSILWWMSFNIRFLNVSKFVFFCLLSSMIRETIAYYSFTIICCTKISVFLYET